MITKLLITVLLSISALCELVGTATVAINYYNNSKFVENLIENPDVHDPFKEKRRVNRLIMNMAAKWYLKVGLISYVVGSLTGLAAGLIWLYSNL